jgi:hypothetical protein
MSKLRADAMVQRVPNIKVLMRSKNAIEVQTAGGCLSCGRAALLILDAFAEPTSLSAGLDRLSSNVSGQQEWIDLTTEVFRLHRAGVLLEVTSENGYEQRTSHGYASALIHTQMLNDRQRTAVFVRAIQEVVRPGDVVIDIGTGTGVLALAAARAGAKHVYAIEATEIGAVAAKMFSANALSNRITLVQGWSTQVSLPEPADVLVSELIGNEPLAESVLEIMRDAHQRLLKPEARLVPDEMRIFGLPISVPDVDDRTFTLDAARKWHDWYGFDFGPLHEMLGHTAEMSLIRPQKAKDWTVLGDPVLFAEIDLKKPIQPTLETAVMGVAKSAGLLNGVIVYFELGLGSFSLSTRPDRADDSNHWSCALWTFGIPLRVQAGDRYCVTYKYRVPGSRDGVHIQLV